MESFTYFKTVVSAVLIFIFFHKVLGFVEKIFDEKKIKRQNRLLMEIMVTGVFVLICQEVRSTAVVCMIAYTLLFIPMYLTWKNKVREIVFLTNAYLVNMMSCYSVVTGIMSVATDASMREVTYQDEFLGGMSWIAVLALLVGVSVFVDHRVKAADILMVAQNERFRVAVILWMGSTNIYMMMQLHLGNYSTETGWTVFANIVVTSMLLLTANWAFFFFNLKIVKLLGFEVQARTDGMTGVYNRMATEQNIEVALENGGTLLVVDVDNFKNVNDTMGHNMGDRLLKNLAFILQDTFRKQDIIGRYGGDEFIVFMRETTDAAVAADRAEALCRACGSTVLYGDNQTCRFSVSVGAAVLEPGEFSEFEAAFKEADLALYKAKGLGKNTYYVYDGDDINMPFKSVQQEK